MARQRNNEIRQKILESAYKRFTQSDFDSTYMKDIAEDCGISTSLLNHYFPTKNDIVIHIIYDLLIKIESFIMENYDEHFKNHREKAIAYNVIILQLFYDVLLRNNNKMLRMYRPIQTDANLMNKVIDYSIARLIPFPELKDTFEKRYGIYLLHGSLAQVVILYLDNNLAFKLTDAIDRLFISYFRSLNFTDKEQEELISFSNNLINEDVKNIFYDIYINSLDNFVTCDW